MTTKAEVGVLWPQAKGRLEPPEATGTQELILSWSLWRGCAALPTS